MHGHRCFAKHAMDPLPCSLRDERGLWARNRKTLVPKILLHQPIYHNPLNLEWPWPSDSVGRPGQIHLWLCDRGDERLFLQLLLGVLHVLPDLWKPDCCLLLEANEPSHALPHYGNHISTFLRKCLLFEEAKSWRNVCYIKELNNNDLAVVTTVVNWRSKHGFWQKWGGLSTGGPNNRL